MPVKKSYYEASLAEYSNNLAAIALLKQHRPYLEMIPSLRRPDDSIITIPLPIVRFRNSATTDAQITCLPCDIAIIMCDPEWKIKTGVEILLFIHRPQEDFSDLLGRWRKTQVLLDKDYEWLMPSRHSHILSDGANTIYPLFVVFSETSERIQRGLVGAELPFIMQTPSFFLEDEIQAGLEASP
ncbi:hypothetical protein [Nodularia sphaerocarpa]|uniref:hypothetical protein n=1 Tax=Nodularia sphaerocarpa TaxID=137816 RepID=UPI001EFAC370|nr:hypothetical protein [Nodularia sphaerocarpa]MDB9371790.1 hypothetical protein [Nodularia sphaerocarpa CS-585]MDB9378070.1 hypothetical protein [Nodularia sphaerocarpa CS-585A2]ULP72279.1 hypothetical protein BDGGKGIB_01918 [Nodularia sphaerocarpa UHCC 0038]